jgi:hypothetical protein
MTRTANMKAYAEMVRVAEELGLPRHYSFDLYKHDKKVLEDELDMPFAWCLRECGTHLVWPDSVFLCGTSRYNKPSSAHVEAIVRIFETEQHWYWWDGVRLRKVEPKRAMTLLDEERARMLREAKAS